jgi:hypothetical protein
VGVCARKGIDAPKSEADATRAAIVRLAVLFMNTSFYHRLSLQESTRTRGGALLTGGTRCTTA